MTTAETTAILDAARALFGMGKVKREAILADPEQQLAIARHLGGIPVDQEQRPPGLRGVVALVDYCPKSVGRKQGWGKGR